MTGVRDLPLARWIVACTFAEMIGMTAAAAAAKAADTAPSPLAALAIIVAGGLLEGAALGLLQANVLKRWLPAITARAWALATLVVAGLGWAAASAPSQLGDATDGGAPPLGLVLAGAAVLGAGMGALLGAVQALVMKGAVPHPVRWIGVSTLAWTPTMTVIFFGATTPDVSWPVAAVIAWGSATGVVAGAVLGAVSGILSSWLFGLSAVNRCVVRVLESRRHGLLDSSLVVLRIRGARTGRTFEIPVQYATTKTGIVVYPGHAERKTWWRNLDKPASVRVLVASEWRSADGRVVRPSDPDWGPGLAAYQMRWPLIGVHDAGPLVAVDWQTQG